MSRKPPELPRTTDEDIDRVIAALSRQVFRDVLELSQRVSVAAEASMRFAPVAISCRHARESRGEDLKSTAKALKVPQVALRHIEEGEAMLLEFSLVARYAHHLGIDEWFGNWVDSNQRLVAMLVQRREFRDSLRPWDLASFEAMMRSTMARTREEEPGEAAPPRRAPHPAPAAGPGQALQLEIRLDGVLPPIWRRVLISADATLHQLHGVLQEAMGWANYHLYVFDFGEGAFSDPTLWDDRPAGLQDARKVRLGDLGLSAGAGFQYRYDFGDDWVHTILVERMGAVSSRRRLPVCLAGARACPPEDSGGPHGYEDKLAAWRDPKHPEHQDIRDWFSQSFDPEGFDLAEVNRRLHQAGRGRRKRDALQLN